MDFSCTSVVASFQQVQCSNCKAIQLLKHQACQQSCLGDTRNQQLLAAQKLKSDLGAPIQQILQSSLSRRHTDLSFQINSLYEQILKFGDQITTPQRPATKQASEQTAENKLKFLQQRLDRLEQVLNVRAAEVFQIKQHAIGILEPQQQPIATDLSPLIQESKLLKKKLEGQNRKTGNARFQLVKLKREEPPSTQYFHRFKRELESDQNNFYHKNKGFKMQIERIQQMNSELTQTVKVAQETLSQVSDSVQNLRKQRESIEILDPNQLLEIAYNVFATHNHMKVCRELTRQYINEQLEQLKGYPSLTKKIRAFSEDLKCFN